MELRELRYLGLGLSADVASVKPDYRRFMEGGESRIDYLNVGAHYTQLERLEYYTNDFVRDFPVVFHPVNFNLASDEAENAEVLDATRAIAEYLDAEWLGQDLALWHLGKQYLGSYLVPPVATPSAAEAIGKKILHLSESIGRQFLIENPPVSFAVGDMHIVDFIDLICEVADCGVVLDVGHLLGYENCIGANWRKSAASRFPFHRVVEVHLAGLQFSTVGGVTNLIDQHAYPIHEECWRFLERHYTKLVNLKGVTLEQEFCANELVEKHIRRAREFIG